MKKIAIAVIIFILLGLAGFLIYKKAASQKKIKEEEKKVVSRKKPALNIIDLEKRPYITLVPREDGREVFMTIGKTYLNEDEVDYQFEYQAGTMLQGASGKVNFKEEPTPITKKILFGSCSKGTCSYDEDVSGGSLTLYCRGKEDYGVKGDFSLAQMKEKKGIFFSRDGKISLNVGGKGLADDVFVICADTIGLPKTVSNKVIAGPIGFFTAAKQTIKQAELTFANVEESGDLKVLTWDGAEWKEFKAIKKNDLLIAEVNQLGTFALVK